MEAKIGLGLGADNGDGIRKANGRLIDAAPELLEACLKLAEWDAREKDHAIDFYERIALCDEAFKLMRAAIAKAQPQEEGKE